MSLPIVEHNGSQLSWASLFLRASAHLVLHLSYLTTAPEVWIDQRDRGHHEGVVAHFVVPTDSLLQLDTPPELFEVAILQYGIENRFENFRVINRIGEMRPVGVINTYGTGEVNVYLVFIGPDLPKIADLVRQSRFTKVRYTPEYPVQVFSTWVEGMLKHDMDISIEEFYFNEKIIQP